MSDVPDWAKQFMPLDASEKAAEIRLQEELKHLKQIAEKFSKLQAASEQPTSEIPEDLRIIHEASSNLSPNNKLTLSACTITHLIERIAALTLERDTLKAEHGKFLELVCKYQSNPTQQLSAYEAIRNHLETAHQLCNANYDWAKRLEAKVEQLSAPPAPLVFTCPFDGEIWRLHTQEQIHMLEKHLEWHSNREQKLPLAESENSKKESNG